MIVWVVFKMSGIAKFLWVLVGIGAFLGVLALFGNNPFHFFSWCFDWIVWFIDSVKNLVSGNQSMREILTTRPSDMAMALLVW